MLWLYKYTINFIDVSVGSTNKGIRAIHAVDISQIKDITVGKFRFG